MADDIGISVAIMADTSSFLPSMTFGLTSVLSNGVAAAPPAYWINFNFRATPCVMCRSLRR